MGVIFGSSSLLIKSFTPKELGFLDKLNVDYTIEIRQICFHIFWIPFFGIGKVWVLNKGNQLFDIPSDFKSILNEAKHDFKAPLATYSGLIIGILIFLVYIGYDKIENYNRYQDDVRWISQKAEKIKNPQLGDIYQLNANDGSFIMKVDSITNDSILFNVPHKNNALTGYQITNENSFNNPNASFDDVWLTKSELLSCCSKTPEDFGSFKGNALKKLIFLSQSKVYLDRIDRK